jgi:hypothetical protein
VIEFYYGEQRPSPSSPIRITDLAWLGRGYISGKGRNKYVPKLDAAAAAAAAAPHSVAGIAALVSAVLFLDSPIPQGSVLSSTAMFHEDLVLAPNHLGKQHTRKT